MKHRKPKVQQMLTVEIATNCETLIEVRDVEPETDNYLADSVRDG